MTCKDRPLVSLNFGQVRVNGNNSLCSMLRTVTASRPLPANTIYMSLRRMPLALRTKIVQTKPSTSAWKSSTISRGHWSRPTFFTATNDHVNFLVSDFSSTVSV